MWTIVLGLSDAAHAQRVRFGGPVDGAPAVTTATPHVIESTPVSVSTPITTSVEVPQYVAAAPAASPASSFGSTLSRGLGWDPYFVASRPAAFSGMVTSTPGGPIVPQPMPRVPYYTQQPVAAPQAQPYVVLPEASCDVPVVAPTQTIVPQLAPPAAVVAQPEPKHWRLYGDFIFWQPGNAATTSFAVPVNGPIVLPDPPVGPVAATDHQFDPGFRAGFAYTSDGVNEWGGMFTFLEASATASTTVDPVGPAVLLALVVHPGTPAATTSFLTATASSDIDLQLADANYRRLYRDPWVDAAVLLGGRYANLKQGFDAEYTNVVTVENVSSQVNFNGGGPRIGLDGEVHSPGGCCFLYGTTSASFIAGRFRSNYVQTDSGLGVVATTSRTDDRIVPILELELGAGWRSANECLRLSAGYYVSGWFNAIGNSEWIDSVQSFNFDDTHDTLTFDGLVARLETRF